MKRKAEKKKSSNLGFIIPFLSIYVALFKIGNGSLICTSVYIG